MPYHNLYHIVVLMPVDEDGNREERIYTVFGRPQAFEEWQRLRTALPQGTMVKGPKLQSPELREPVC